MISRIACSYQQQNENESKTGEFDFRRKKSNVMDTRAKTRLILSR